MDVQLKFLHTSLKQMHNYLKLISQQFLVHKIAGQNNII